MQRTISQPQSCQSAPRQQRRVIAHASLAPAGLPRRTLLAGLAAGLLLASSGSPSTAMGLESIDLPAIEMPSGIATAILEKQEREKAVLDFAEDKFQQSDFLRELKERTEANREQRDKALREKYCMRQAELGVGDCAGLRLIPGATKSGVQQRPQWLDDLVFGKKEE